MARRSLPSVSCNRNWVAESVSMVAMSTESAQSSPAVGIESTRRVPVESSCRFESSNFL